MDNNYRPQAVYFCTDGIWIVPHYDEPYRYNGPALELLSILIYHTELDITDARFRVQAHEFAVDA